MAGLTEQAVVERLKPIARRLREDVIRMITAAGSGHPGGSLSAAEIVTALVFHTLRRRAGDPTWANRDRFVMSKGHCVPALGRKTWRVYQGMDVMLTSFSEPSKSGAMFEPLALNATVWTRSTPASLLRTTSSACSTR